MCAAVVPRTGGRPRNPYLRRDWMRRSRRLAAGMSPREVARAEQVDEAEIQDLLQRTDFAALVQSWHAIDALPQAEQIRRLVILARQAIEQALCDWDMPAAFFVLRENERGRDPAETIANGIIAAARRRARTSTAPPPGIGRQPIATAARSAPTGRPRRAGDLARRRQAARRHRCRARRPPRRVRQHTAGPHRVAATMAAARKALAAKPTTTSPGLPAATRLARSLTFTSGPTALRPAPEPLVAGPVATLPRRARAP